MRDAGTNYCSEGRKVLTLVECKKAMKVMMRELPSTLNLKVSSWPASPKGCYVYNLTDASQGTWAYYYNTHAIGKGHINDFSICAKTDC